jgi:hypothetical protein
VRNIYFLFKAILQLHLKLLRSASSFNRTLDLSTQAFLLACLKTIVNNFCLILTVNSCNVCVFCKIIICKKLDLFEPTSVLFYFWEIFVYFYQLFPVYVYVLENIFIIKQVTLNKSSLLLKIDLQNTQTM